MLAFDWKIGIPLLILMILGFLIQMMCMGKDTMSFMKTYQDALEDMNHEAVEYVRGISVVKVFGQSVHSIKKFKAAIETYKKYAFAFTMSCKKGMVAFNTIINASFVVLVPAALIVGATSDDLVGFIEKFLGCRYRKNYPWWNRCVKRRAGSFIQKLCDCFSRCYFV